MSTRANPSPVFVPSEQQIVAAYRDGFGAEFYDEYYPFRVKIVAFAHRIAALRPAEGTVTEAEARVVFAREVLTKCADAQGPATNARDVCTQMAVIAFRDREYPLPTPRREVVLSDGCKRGREYVVTYDPARVGGEWQAHNPYAFTKGTELSSVLVARGLTPTDTELRRLLALAAPERERGA